MDDLFKAFCCLAIVLYVSTAIGGEPKSKSTSFASALTSSDWPWWRGPERNGVASSDQKPPLHWSDTENVIWRTAIPGRGHGSPTIVGDRIYLQTADLDRNVQTVLCLDRKTGGMIWQQDLHKGGVESKGNIKSSHANSTVACDGERIFATFLNEGAVYTTALGLDGSEIWQTKVTDFVVHQGFGSSPAIYENLVIVSADNRGSGAVAGLEKSSGKIVWKQERPKLPNYTSPIILHVAGQDQVIVFGCNLVTSYEPLTGKKNWEIQGSTEECVTSTVTDGKLIYTSGGYPRNHMSAIRADGSGKVAWENGMRVYVPSMLFKDGYLYAVLDAGVASCWKCDTGTEIWKHRIPGTFSSSPVLVGEKIFVTNETGLTYIFLASPKGYEEIAQNKLAEDVFATPTICGGRIYMRAASTVEGKRQESLYCIGTK